MCVCREGGGRCVFVCKRESADILSKDFYVKQFFSKIDTSLMLTRTMVRVAKKWRRAWEEESVRVCVCVCARARARERERERERESRGRACGFRV